MKLKFLGTGAADWNGRDENGYLRRLTSTLLDGALLIDVTKTVLDMINQPDAITDVFFTHSHADHFSIEALQSLAPCRVYAHESWVGEIEGTGLTVIPLKIGEAVKAGRFSVIPLPANHSTERAYEQPVHYLIEKEGKRLLYATDGAWMLNRAHQIIGKQSLDAAVFDATIGDGHDGDWRVFEHNSIDMVRLMIRSMYEMGRLKKNAPVYLTHLARTLHAPQPLLEKQIESPMVVCRDGLEAEF